MNTEEALLGAIRCLQERIEEHNEEGLSTELLENTQKSYMEMTKNKKS